MRRLIVWWFALAVLIAGCDPKKGGKPAVGTSGKLVVVSSIFPVHDLVKTVGGDAVEAVVLLKPGASVHGFNPSTKLAKTVARSKLAFVVGLELDGWAKKTVEAAGGKIPIVELGAKLKAKTFEVNRVGAHAHAAHDDHDDDKKHDDKKHDDKKHDDEKHDDKKHDDKKHDDEKHDDNHDKKAVPTKGDDHHDEKKAEPKKDDDHHHPAGPDPHVWLSVKNTIAMVAHIEQALTKAAPGKKATFAKNAKALTAELRKLDAEIRKTVASFKRKSLVTFHGSFGYFAAEYGLNIVAVIEPFPGKKPSAAYLKEVLGALKGKQVAALFTEPQLDKRPAEVLAKEAKLLLKVLDPLGGLDGRDSYVKLMRFNLAQLSGTMK